VEHAEDAAAIAAQVNDDARRVAHRAQGSAELSQDRNGKKIKAYVTDVLSQSPRFKLDKERRERLHGRRHLAFESLASDAHAMHTVERVEIRDARVSAGRAVEVTDDDLGRQ